jgi:four helix bundle protein
MTPTGAPTITPQVHHPDELDERPAPFAAVSSSGLAAEVDRLAVLTTFVDRASAQQPLAEHPGLRAQMRRSAMDAISHAACAAEATSLDDYQRFLLRTLSALRELDTLTRIGLARQAVSPGQAHRIGDLVAQILASLERALQGERSTTRGTAMRPAAGLSGAA